MAGGGEAGGRRGEEAGGEERREQRCSFHNRKPGRQCGDRAPPCDYRRELVETLETENRLKIGPRTPPGVQTDPFFALGAAVATRGPPEGQLPVSQTARL